jgi:outer membrane protein TolC
MRMQKNFRGLGVGLLSLAILLTTSNSYAASKPAFPTPPPPPRALTVNPETLRTVFLERNLSVIMSFLAVKDSKDFVSQKRFALFPSINLGVMLSSFSSFGASSISFLLPFLAPSNWFNYKAQKQQFEADKIAFHLFELNTYSSALSSYYTYLNDQQFKDVYIREYNDLKKVADIAEHLASIGAMNVNDVKPLRAAANDAGISFSKLNQLNDQEIESLRHSLGFDFSTDLTIAAEDMPTSGLENLSVQKAADKAFAIAPEHQQIQFLVKVAAAQKWSAAFSWIGGGAIGSSGAPGSMGGSASFSNMSASGQVNLGFGLIPTISLANRNIDKVKLTDIELQQSTNQIVASSVKNIVDSKKQIAWGIEAERNVESAYRVLEARFKLGLVTVTEVLVARANMTKYSLDRVAAQMNLNLQRVVLHRAGISGEFAKIKGCNYDGAKMKKASLDLLCLGRGEKATQ